MSENKSNHLLGALSEINLLLKKKSAEPSMNKKIILNWGEENLGSRGGFTLEEVAEVVASLNGVDLPIEWDMGMMNIEDAHAEALAPLILNAKQALKLDLSCNLITYEGAKTLAAALKESQAPIYLDLERNRIGVAGIISLVEASNNRIHPTSLNLQNISKPRRSKLKDDFEQGISLIATAIKNNKAKFIEFHLCDYQISDEGFTQLGDALKNTLRPVALTLKACQMIGTRCDSNEDNNEFGSINDKSIEELANALRSTTQRIDLDISNNKISNKGIDILTDTLNKLKVPCSIKDDVLNKPNSNINVNTIPKIIGQDNIFMMAASDPLSFMWQVTKIFNLGKPQIFNSGAFPQPKLTSKILDQAQQEVLKVFRQAITNSYIDYYDEKSSQFLGENIIDIIAYNLSLNAIDNKFSSISAELRTPEGLLSLIKFIALDEPIPCAKPSHAPDIEEPKIPSPFINLEQSRSNTYKGYNK